MKNIAPCLFVMVALCLQSNLMCQTEFATIKKNRNLRAEGLFHDLNTSKDTLVLKSHTKIDYLYAIPSKNPNSKQHFTIDSTEYKIPLNQFKKGKHVFVAVQSPLEIVFVVNVLHENPNLNLKNIKTILKETVVGTDDDIEH